MSIIYMPLISKKNHTWKGMGL